MIKSNELRLGNWISDDVGQKVKVSIIRSHTIHYDLNGLKNNLFINVDNLIPILISDQILLQCGFVKANDVYGGYLSPLINEKCRFRVRDDFTWHSGFGDVELKYLHQLQNLYFLLSKEELVIKL